jgi:hypothetical protein
MTPEEIFTYRYRRLSELLRGGEASQLLDVSAILREFLIDSPNIVDMVNKQHKKKVFYKVFQSSRDQAEEFAIGNVKPTLVLSGTTLPPFAPLTPLNRDEFLKFEIITIQDNHITVQQVVKACANKFGGKHFERPGKDDREVSLLRKLDDIMSLAGAPAVFSSLILIGNITVEALAELYQAVPKSIGAA